MARHRSRLVTTLALAAVAASVPASAQVPSYHVDIVAPPAGYDSAFAVELTANAVLGYAGSDPYDPLVAPFLYKLDTGAIRMLGMPTDSLNFPMGAGSPGLAAGTSSGFPYVWHRTTPVPLRPAGGLAPGFAGDVIRSGSVCGAVVNDLTGQQFPAFWENPLADGVLLPGLNGVPYGAAFAMNERGQIAGAAGGLVGVFYGARWDSSTSEPLQVGPLDGAMNSELLTINSSGDAAGRSSFEDGSTEALVFLDDTREVIGLGFLPDGLYSFANGMNDLRQVVGTAATTGPVVHAFLWQDGVLHDLNDLVGSSSEPFLYLSNAVSIDNQGRIAAEAVVSVPPYGLQATRIAILTPMN